MPSPRRIIAIGHAALDRIYRIEAFPPQPTKVRALEHIEVGGGMAANAAVCMARLGGKIELWSRVGDDAAGQAIKSGLKAEKVDVRYVQQFDNARSSTSAIIVDDGGERLIVNNRDTGMPSSTDWLPLERIKGAGAVLGDVRWLEGLRRVFAQARADGVPTVLDADLGAREIMPELLELTDYAIFSEPALAELAQGADDPARLAHVAGLGVRHVGVTRGAKGYLWRDADGEHSIPAHPVDMVVDTTGAGDAFHGAFTLFLAEGHPVDLCARAGAIAAAEKCGRLGGRAGLPTRQRLDQLMADTDSG
jgi:sulfofructose kinase